MQLTRRLFLQASTAAVGSMAGIAPALVQASSNLRSIDRYAVVSRHNPDFSGFDPYNALSLGNGEFAFTADLTGLQTLTAECQKDFPLCTTAHWAWHTLPATPDIRPEQFRFRDYDTHGRPVGYATDAKGQEDLFNWLRQNPHRLHLGRIGFSFGGREAQLLPSDLRDSHQHLDLWSGLLESQFHLMGTPVKVFTCCHPELDCLAVRVESPLLASGQARILFAFPYGSPEVAMADWKQPDRHTTELRSMGSNSARFVRRVDQSSYVVDLDWSGRGRLCQSDPHHFLLSSTSPSLEFVCRFSPEARRSRLPSFDRTRQASARHWKRYWGQGGMIDLGGSTDNRAPELERRMVLSLYQTAIHCAGSLPSAETGLLFNSWYGKFHLEMHWWHSVHFAAWNRFSLFEKTLAFYHRILPVARSIAARQGYAGGRWPKMVGPEGYDAPSPVGPLLIWQQPHPIYYAELCYRERPSRRTLERWREVVFATADFMACYAAFDPATGRFVLGPPLKTVSENNDPLTSCNPTFELSYWRFGLRVAQAWRERLGLAREPAWDRVLNGLAPLAVHNGLYLMQEGMLDTFAGFNWEHPALVGAFGMLPGDGVDPTTMRRTVRRVSETWQWERTWGWDFPMMAMAAARVGEPELAIQALSVDVPKNRYWPNGHNYQRENLTAYLPGNGGLLSALAMMAAGWTGGPSRHAPGFPASRWKVRHEDLRTWL